MIKKPNKKVLSLTKFLYDTGCASIFTDRLNMDHYYHLILIVKGIIFYFEMKLLI